MESSDQSGGRHVPTDRAVFPAEDDTCVVYTEDDAPALDHVRGQQWDLRIRRNTAMMKFDQQLLQGGI